MAINRADVPAGADKVLYSVSNRGCTTFRIDVPSDSSYGVEAHVDGLHSDNEYVIIAAGASKMFRYYDDGIKRVVVQGYGGTATNVTWGAVSKTAAGHN
jgi:hypothetical protein